MKKILALALALMMVLSLAACGDKEESTPTPAPKPEVTVPSDTEPDTDTVKTYLTGDEDISLLSEIKSVNHSKFMFPTEMHDNGVSMMEYMMATLSAMGGDEITPEIQSILSSPMMMEYNEMFFCIDPTSEIITMVVTQENKDNLDLSEISDEEFADMLANNYENSYAGDAGFDEQDSENTIKMEDGSVIIPAEGVTVTEINGEPVDDTSSTETTDGAAIEAPGEVPETANTESVPTEGIDESSEGNEISVVSILESSEDKKIAKVTVDTTTTDENGATVPVTYDGYATLVVKDGYCSVGMVAFNGEKGEPSWALNFIKSLEIDAANEGSENTAEAAMEQMFSGFMGGETSEEGEVVEGEVVEGEVVEGEVIEDTNKTSQSSN